MILYNPHVDGVPALAWESLRRNRDFRRRILQECGGVTSTAELRSIARSRDNGPPSPVDIAYEFMLRASAKPTGDKNKLRAAVHSLTTQWCAVPIPDQRLFMRALGIIPSRVHEIAPPRGLPLAVIDADLMTGVLKQREAAWINKVVQAVVNYRIIAVPRVATSPSHAGQVRSALLKLAPHSGRRFGLGDFDFGTDAGWQTFVVYDLFRDLGNDVKKATDLTVRRMSSSWNPHRRSADELIEWVTQRAPLPKGITTNHRADYEKRIRSIQRMIAGALSPLSYVFR